MKKDVIIIRKKTIFWVVVIFLSFLLVVLAKNYIPSPNYPPSLQPNNFSNTIQGIYFNFKDTTTNCSLDGNVSINNKNVGTTNRGSFYLAKPEHDQYFSPYSSLELDGITNPCFGKDSGLPFVLGWPVHDLTYYFNNNKNVSFETPLLKPRSPESYAHGLTLYRIIQGFIRPSETIDYYNNNIEKYMKNNTQNDLDYIGGFIFNYRSNALLFNSNYWTTPGEFLSAGKGGDCKDYSLTVLSMIKNYNSSLNCYDVLWSGPLEGHMNIFCHYGNIFVIYDQNQINSKVSLSQESLNSIGLVESKTRVREMIGNYYSKFVLPDDEVVTALISDKEIISFNEITNNEEFINWIISQVS